MPIQDKITELGNLVDSQFQNASIENKITAPEVTDAFGKVMSIVGEAGAELAQKTAKDAQHDV